MSKNKISKLADYVKNSSTKSCRKLAAAFNTSKSSIHRRQKKINARSGIAGAAFFETEEGQSWILQLVVATVLVFGIIAGIGADRLALFLSLIMVDAFVGVSPSSISRYESHLDDLIIKYKAKYDAEISSKAVDLEITPGVDETFFDKMMLLVGMDLQSGFLFIEKPAAKRDHDTWKINTMPWISRFKIVRCFVTDKAKALLKLAETAGVNRIPDLFHIMSDVSKTMKYSFHRAQKGIDKSIKSTETLIAKGVDIAKNQQILSKLQTKFKQVSLKQLSYQKNLRKLSTSLHPFEILSSKRQSSVDVEKRMNASLEKIKEIKEDLKISDTRKRLVRAQRQIPDAAKQIDLWWRCVTTSLDSADISAERKDWLLYCLLPLVYWRTQLKKARSKRIKRFYSSSIGNALKHFESHQMTSSAEIGGPDSEWFKWAQKMTDIFIRTTSAVEGRNGWLSQMHFNGRGLSEKRLTSQTAIHNYYLKRSDGTTACERLSGIKPDDLFEYLLSHARPLSEPRRRKIKNQRGPLNLLGVPA